MVMKAMRYGASNRFIKTILFGLLMLAAIGLAFTGGSSFSTGGVGRSDVARIGGEKVSLASFDRDLRRTLGRIGIGVPEAYKLGYIDQFLSGEVRNRIIARSADDMGIIVDQARVAQQVRKMIEPMTKEGQNPKEVLQQILMNQGMTERDLVNSISRETSINVLASTLQNGLAPLPENLIVDLYKAQNESRSIDYVIFLDKDLKDLRAPSDDDLNKLYEASKEMFAIPEMRTLKLIKIKDEALRKTLEITDEEIKQVYESNIGNYRTSAEHTLEQSIFATEDMAQKMYEAVKSGKSMEQASKDMKQISAYLGKLDIEDTKIQEELKESVLKAKEGELLAPLKNKLGWNVIRVEKISPEYTKTFESVKKEIKDELYDTKLIDQKYALANQLDDLLASGAGIDAVSGQMDVTVSELPSMNSFGQGANKTDVIKPYEKISSAIMDAGFKLNEGETSPVSEMADGSFMAVHVQSVTPKSYKPFAEVKSDLEARWKQDLAQTENRARATNLLNELKEGKKSFSEAGATKKITLSRMQEIPSGLSERFMVDVFQAKIDVPVLTAIDGGVALAMVTSASWPESVDQGSADFKKFHEAIVKDSQNQVIGAYIDYKGRKYKAATNVELIRQAYGQNNDTAQ